MNITKIALLLFFCAMLVSACEKDLPSVPLRPGTPVLNVDGWITDRQGGDTIRLTKTVNFFEQTKAPAVTGAAITLADDHGNTEQLEEVSTGVFAIKKLRATVNYKYTLTVRAAGETYTATTSVSRLSPVIDSLTFRYYPEGGNHDSVGYRVKIWGQELAGKGDALRILIKRNGVPQNQIDDLNIYNDDNVEGNYIQGLEMNSFTGYKTGDRLTVEQWSLDPEAYNFWNQLKTQVDNGGLFAPVPANVPTNVRNVDPASAKVATGYFGASLSDILPVSIMK
ncbi:DUF4249 domain-containing protein [Mucilaginibacter sp. JRF]|uniref:DUF4249 domain-containing protein n=1 Tax=Mucilaginibacter sp. JRF TaxID=2780088 RepID=UPI001880B0D4|nr:DUF4249 domain-containing protein [Mucilaginibacter sp. JRF]MBE9583271.1 DUF4249 domain-containing protein [Mucilaginibacter sp. JRF]